MADLAEVVRGERGRIVAALVRLCGGLDAAEDAFQAAALSALETWREPPANPGAWLMTAARNRALDARRHETIVERGAPAPERVDQALDDYLRLLFTCCHPALSLDSRVALALKVVAGFTTDELARAFLTTEATISQRILRAKQALADEDPALPFDLHARVASVVATIYAIFTEGHVATRGELMRVDLQAEALRLARALADLAPDNADVFGLLALIALGASRAPARIADGLPVLLRDQDRSRWDRGLLREGFIALSRARRLGGSTYVIEAELAATHAVAPSWAATDWPRIVALYDALPASPIVQLNRAIALAMRDGPAAGLAALAPLEPTLSTNHLFYAARFELSGDRADLERALALVTNDAERALLARRLG